MKKKSNFKTAAFILVLAISAVPVFAQPGQGQGQGRGQGQGQGQRRQMSEEDVKNRVGALADTLKLTDKQEKEVLAFELEYYKTLQKERANFDPETGDRDAMRAKMMKLREERDAKYKTVLTAQQHAKFTKMEEDRRSQMRQRQGGGQDQSSDGQRSRGRGGN